MSENVLRIEHVTMQFGGVVAVDDLNLVVNRNEIVSLIGPNGAGKTTAFNVITGVYAPTNGRVYFEGKSIVENHPRGKMKKLYEGANADQYLKTIMPTPDKITKLGIARTFQNIRLFKSQTVFENILIAEHMRRTSNLFTATLHLNGAEEREMRSEAERLLHILELDDVRDEMATSLPYGKQRRVEIARALATKPSLLLLDEPAAGMNPQETLELTEFIGRIRDDFHLTIFMIEHHMDLVMQISDRVYVLDFGKLIAHGTPDEVQNDPNVIRAYPVRGISFEVSEGEVVTLIGANGAGKSSTLRSIVGLVKPSAGQISFEGQELRGMNTENIVKQGITLVPEGRRVFVNLTVYENLKMGAYMRKDRLDDDLNWVYELFPRLKERSWQSAGTLSGGEQQMLAIGRALMSRPKLIMMDEPSLGLAPIVVQGVFDIIKEINRQGVTILLVEQNANMALKAADRAYVMETGRITMSGTGRELSENEEIRAAYLGKSKNN